MATVPPIRDWTDEHLTAAKMDEISAMLDFLRDVDGGICYANATGTQSIGNTTDTPIDFDTTEVNRDSMWSAFTPSRITANTAGWYALGGVVVFDTNATGYRIGKFRKTSGFVQTVLRASSVGAVSGANTWVDISMRIVFLSPGDYVELLARQNSGGSLNTSTADGACQMSVIRLAS